MLRYVQRRSRKKFKRVWTGPYRIIDAKGEFTVVLNEGTVVNVSDLKLYGSRNMKMMTIIAHEYVKKCFSTGT